MKVITAIGSEELNNILKSKENIEIENSDIQYQDGILETLEKYTDVELLIINEDIIGVLEINELIKEISILNENIKIIVITKDEKNIRKCKQIIKTIKNTDNYIQEIINNICEKREEIKIEKIDNTKEEILNIKENVFEENIEIKENQFNNKIKFKPIIKEHKKIKGKNNIISIIGVSGVRENNIYINFI